MYDLVQTIIKELEQTVPENKPLQDVKADLLRQVNQLKSAELLEFYLRYTGGVYYSSPVLTA